MCCDSKEKLIFIECKLEMLQMYHNLNETFTHRIFEMLNCRKTINQNSNTSMFENER